MGFVPIFVFPLLRITNESDRQISSKKKKKHLSIFSPLSMNWISVSLFFRSSVGWIPLFFFSQNGKGEKNS